MNPRLVYDNSFFDGTDDDTLGFAFVAPLIAAAPGIFQSIMGLFGGGRKAQYQGLAEIQQAGQQAVSAMEQILSGLRSRQMSPAQAVQESQKILGQFNDPSIVYPAKKGKDAEARNQFLSQLSALDSQIKAAAASASSGSNAGGISTNTLLLAGLGIGALYLLKN
ncbi:MAG: hypothetical protein KIT61_07940 [Pyrinomonadaceae bacterium]|nr:hypothetical protein [Pyrinomonadaceae bacterium]